jgi:hypothetical protein
MSTRKPRPHRLIRQRELRERCIRGGRTVLRHLLDGIDERQPEPFEPRRKPVSQGRIDAHEHARVQREPVADQRLGAALVRRFRRDHRTDHVSVAETPEEREADEFAIAIECDAARDVEQLRQQRRAIQPARARGQSGETRRVLRADRTQPLARRQRNQRRLERRALMLMNRVDAREALFLAQRPAFVRCVNQERASAERRDQPVEQPAPDAPPLMFRRHDEHAERRGMRAELKRERRADQRTGLIDGGEAIAETRREAPVVRAMPPFDGCRQRVRRGNVVERESPVFDHIVIARVGHAGLLTLKTFTVTLTPRSAHG